MTDSGSFRATGGGGYAGDSAFRTAGTSTGRFRANSIEPRRNPAPPPIVPPGTDPFRRPAATPDADPAAVTDWWTEEHPVTPATPATDSWFGEPVPRPDPPSNPPSGRFPVGRATTPNRPDSPAERSGQHPPVPRPGAERSGHHQPVPRPGNAERSGQHQPVPRPAFVAEPGGPVRDTGERSGHHQPVARPGNAERSGQHQPVARPAFVAEPGGPVRDTGERSGHHQAVPRPGNGERSGQHRPVPRPDGRGGGTSTALVRRPNADVARRTRSRRRSRWPFGVIVVVLIVIGGYFAWTWVHGKLSNEASAAAAQCVEGQAVVRVAAAPEIARAARAAASDYTNSHPVVADHCVVVQVSSADPAAALAGLSGGTWDTAKLGPKPQAWLPDSTLWTNRLSAQNAAAVADIAQSVAASPVVLAMPPDAAKAVQAAGEPSWTTIGALAGNPNGWATFGQPGWGRFTLAVPDPSANAASELALTSILDPSTPQGQQPVTAGLLSGPAHDPLTGLAAEQAAVPAGTMAALQALGQAGGEASAPYSAVPVTEVQLYERNLGLDGGGKPAGISDEVRVSGTTAFADFPYLPLAGNWVSSAQVAAAQGFRAYLLSGPAQAKLSAAGFRISGNSTHPTPAPGLDWGAVGQAATPVDTAGYTALSAAWADARSHG